MADKSSFGGLNFMVYTVWQKSDSKGPKVLC